MQLTKYKNSGATHWALFSTVRTQLSCVCNPWITVRASKPRYSASVLVVSEHIVLAYVWYTILILQNVLSNEITIFETTRFGSYGTMNALDTSVTPEVDAAVHWLQFNNNVTARLDGKLYSKLIVILRKVHILHKFQFIYQQYCTPVLHNSQLRQRATMLCGLRWMQYSSC